MKKRLVLLLLATLAISSCATSNNLTTGNLQPAISSFSNTSSDFKNPTQIKDNKSDNGAKKLPVKFKINMNMPRTNSAVSPIEAQRQKIAFDALKSLTGNGPESTNEIDVLETDGDWDGGEYVGANISVAYKFCFSKLQQINAVNNKNDWRADMSIIAAQATNSYYEGLRLSMIGLSAIRDKKPENNLSTFATHAYNLSRTPSGWENTYRVSKLTLEYILKNTDNNDLRNEIKNELNEAAKLDNWADGAKLLQKYLENMINSRKYSNIIINI